jgi:sec-independent protein translocase protein TatC
MAEPLPSPVTPPALPAPELAPGGRRRKALPHPDDTQMPFLEHVRELRVRLRNAIAALIVGVMIAYAFAEHLFKLLVEPLLSVWSEKAAQDPNFVPPAIYFGSLVEPFWTYFDIALWAGIFIASPVIFYQLWQFIAPGLYARERRFGVGFAFSSVICFLGGAAFCYFFVLPVIFDFFLGYATGNMAKITGLAGLDYNIGQDVALRPHLFMQEYLDLARKMLLGFGVVFELPLLILFLSAIGVVTHRGLWKFNRWAIVLSFVVGAILTPPDVVSQTMMSVPLVLLYNLSIGISYVVTRRRERREAALASDIDPDAPPAASA